MSAADEIGTPPRDALRRRRASMIILWHVSFIVCVLTLGAGRSAAQTISTACPAMASSTFFFPELTLDRNPRADAILREWFSGHLMAMREPSLSCGVDAARTVFRLTWLRTFDYPVSVRVEKSAQGNVQLVAVELSGAGGYEPGTIRRTENKTLGADQWRLLERKLRKGVFGTSERERGLDGSEWIFERALDGKYDVSVEWSPDSGPRRELGVYLLSLSGWTFGDVY
jgi:hypothetical protein